MTRRAVVATRVGFVQAIRLYWTKAGRGGEGARARNTVPLALELPLVEFGIRDGGLCLDISRWSDRTVFREPFESRRECVPLANGYAMGCVSITPDAAGLRVCYRHEPTIGGAPDRRAFAPGGHREPVSRTLCVKDGEWVRVCYNGRFSGDEGWWYEQVTVNVAWCVGEPDGRMFLDREPTRQILALADLW